MNNSDVWILSPIPAAAEDQNAAASAQSVIFKNKLDPKKLAKSLQEFSSEICGALEKVSEVAAEFSLHEVEISAVAGADGSLMILGAEFGGKFEGAVKLVFRRKAHPAV